MNVEHVIRTLSASPDAEAAAEVVARAALRRVLDEAAPGVELLRAAVHLRPEAGYRGLVVVEHGDAPADASPATSATAWNAVRERTLPVALDVVTESFSEPDGTRITDASSRAFASRIELLRRSTTHLLACPLVRPGGGAVGMLVVEVSCRAAIGTPLPLWEAVAPDLGLLGLLAAGPLALLPQRRVDDDLEDPLLPVVGATMAPVVRTLDVFAALDQTLLLRGATGTGKSHLAKRCHARSGRGDAPFITVQLHTLPETLREGELFGWRRGAFTGAQRDHEGAVSRAGAGTLFIDEVDKLAPDAQARLLRLLEERRYSVLGESVERTTTARFIVGTNQDLEAAVADGRFLRDLYYRINVLPIRVPTLAERRDEIDRWAHHMLSMLSPDGPLRLSRAAALELERQPWPGNLRQLNSVVTRAFALAMMEQGAEGIVVDAGHVERALSMDAGGGPRPLRRALEAAADALVGEALARKEDGRPGISLDDLDVFRGLVLAAAVQATGDEAEACALLGLGRLVRWSNHRKVIRREHGRVAALYAALDLPPPWDPLAPG